MNCVRDEEPHDLIWGEGNGTVVYIQLEKSLPLSAKLVDGSLYNILLCLEVRRKMKILNTHV